MYHLEKEILKKGGKEKRKHKKSSCHNSINTNSMLSEIMFTSNFHEADSYSQKNFPYPKTPYLDQGQETLFTSEN